MRQVGGDLYKYQALVYFREVMDNGIVKNEGRQIQM